MGPNHPLSGSNYRPGVRVDLPKSNIEVWENLYKECAIYWNLGNTDVLKHLERLDIIVIFTFPYDEKDTTPFETGSLEMMSM